MFQWKERDAILISQMSNSQWTQGSRVNAHLLPQAQEQDLMPGHCTVAYCCYYTGCRMSETQRMHFHAKINKSPNPIYVFYFRLSPVFSIYIHSRVHPSVKSIHILQVLLVKIIPWIFFARLSWSWDFSRNSHMHTAAVVGVEEVIGCNLSLSGSINHFLISECDRGYLSQIHTHACAHTHSLTHILTSCWKGIPLKQGKVQS